MSPETGAARSFRAPGPPRRQTSLQHRPEPEVQHHHIRPSGSLRAVQILSQSILSCDGLFAIHS